MPLKTKILFLGLLPIVGIAVATYFYQLFQGLGVTGMSKPVFWGIYIVNFAFFIGVSAGGIAIASLCHLAGIEKFKPIGRVTEIVAIISVVLGLSCIFVDLGRPDHILNFIFNPQFGSPLIWDFMVINTYLAISVMMLASDVFGWHRLTKVFAVIAIPVFVSVHSVTAWIFGLVKAQPAWHTAILAPLFISSALVSGLALVILTLLFSRRFLKFKLDDDVIVSLGNYYLIFLPILFYLLFSEMITVFYAGVPLDMAVLKDLYFGRFAKLFWFDMVAGIVIPFLIMVTPLRKRIWAITLASLLSLLGVLAERVNIIIPSFFHSRIHAVAMYHPNWVEFTIVGGIYCLGLLMFIGALQVIPLTEKHGG